MSPRASRARRSHSPAIFLGLGFAWLGPVACEKPEFEPPDRAERVQQAEAGFDPAAFDTIAWESSELRVQVGNIVYAAHCRKCHGFLGRGDTEYAREEGLHIPSLVEPGWEVASDTMGVRRRIFAGHPERMPTWGVAGISLREIDAVTAYLLEQLRPEVLDTRGNP